MNYYCQPNSYTYYPPYDQHVYNQYQYQYQHNPYHGCYFFQRNPPQIKPDMFMNSARQTMLLWKDARTILQKISISRPYALEIMNAAQASNKVKITKLIHSAGLKIEPQVSYTPDGLVLTFIYEKNNIDCCHLILKIRWGDP